MFSLHERRLRQQPGPDFSVISRRQYRKQNPAASAFERSGHRIFAFRRFSRCRQHLRTVLALCAAILLLCACAAVEPINTQPFREYQSAIASLKENSDQALQVVYQEEFDQFKDELRAGEVDKVTELMLDFPDNSHFAWSYPGSSDNEGTEQPVFASIADMRQTLAAMNTQLLDYAGLLLALAGADESSEFDAAAEAEKFHENAGELLQRLATLDVSTDGVDSRDLALFSTIAANLARTYLEDKRIELLTDILNAGLDPLQAFVDKAQGAMALTANNAKTQYQNRVKPLARELAESSGSSDLEELLSLNERIIQQLKLYRNIYSGYGALPAAQRQLIIAVKENQDVGLGELINYATSIQQQYEALNKRGGGEPAGD